MKTKVIFRQWNNGDIIAIFPEIAGNNQSHTCMSYEHIGQHGACWPESVIAVTSPVNLGKNRIAYQLHTELTQIGYTLQIIKRYSHKTYEPIRKAEIKGGKHDK